MAQDKDRKTPNVPPLRFPGFSDDWKTAKLSDFLKENKERNTKGDFSKEDVLSVSGEKGVVNQIQLLGRSYAGKSVLPYHIVRQSNIVYTKSPLSEFPYGIVKMNRGIDGIVSTLYAVYSVLDSANPSFIEYYFASKERTNRYFKPIVRIGAKHDMKIGNAEVLANNVTFPNKIEQSRISEFMELIDERIATQNKIIEDLKKLKSAIIDSHFTKKDSISKIGDYVFEVSNRNKTKDNLPVLSVSNRLGFIAQYEQFGDRTIASEDTSNYKIVENNDFAYNPARINVGSIARLTNYERGIVSPMYVCLRCKDLILPEYLELLFQSRYFQSQVDKRLEGSVRLCLSIERIKSIQFKLIPISKQRILTDRLRSIQSKLDIEETIRLLYQSQREYLLTNIFT